MDQRVVESASEEFDEPDANGGSTMEQSPRRHNKAKVLVVMFIAVVFGALGDISLRNGMRAIGATEFRSMYHALLAAIDNIYVIAGAAGLLAFLLLYLASLSWEDLSYVLPLTAADYVLVTILAFVLLHENVSPLRWIGSLMVAAGIAVVAKT